MVCLLVFTEEEEVFFFVVKLSKRGGKMDINDASLREHDTRIVAAKIMKEVSQYWFKKGGTVFVDNSAEPTVVFETLNGISSVHFTIKKDLVIIEINWDIYLGDIRTARLGEISVRMSLSAELIKKLNFFGFDYSFEGLETTSIMMRRNYKSGITEDDLEALLIVMRRYFDRAEKILKK